MLDDLEQDMGVRTRAGGRLGALCDAPATPSGHRLLSIRHQRASMALCEIKGWEEEERDVHEIT